MAVGTYTVAEPIERGRSYENKNQPGTNLVVWKLRLVDAEPDTPGQMFELHKKEDSKAPAAGDEIEVKRFAQGEFSGQKFIRIYQEYTARPDGQQQVGVGRRDDATGQSIERQVAAKVAAEMVCAAVATSNAPNPGVMVANFEAMFDSAIAKIQGVPESAPKPAQEIPADTNGLEPQSQVADASLPF